MLRAIDLGMFLAPTALFVAWLVLGRVATLRFALAGAVIVIGLGVMAAFYGIDRSIPGSEQYVPARLENGRVVPGHGVAPAKAP